MLNIPDANPRELLQGDFAEYAQSVAESFQATAWLGIAASLGAATVAISGNARLRAPNGTIVPAALWIGGFGTSGVGKTAAFEPAANALRNMDEKCADAFTLALDAYEDEKFAWKAHKGEKPVKKSRIRIISDGDATYKETQRQLRANPGGFGIVTNCLGVFLNRICSGRREGMLQDVLAVRNGEAGCLSAIGAVSSHGMLEGKLGLSKAFYPVLDAITWIVIEPAPHFGEGNLKSAKIRDACNAILKSLPRVKPLDVEWAQPSPPIPAISEPQTVGLSDGAAKVMSEFTKKSKAPMMDTFLRLCLLEQCMANPGGLGHLEDVTTESAEMAASLTLALEPHRKHVRKIMNKEDAR